MRSHCTYSSTQPYTLIRIDDESSETPASTPARRAVRSLAILGLVLGIGSAVLMMLGTWLSLSTQATDSATTFVVHSEEQTLSANELEGMSLPPPFLDDILAHF
jgi:hypothetical protein